MGEKKESKIGETLDYLVHNDLEDTLGTLCGCFRVTCQAAAGLKLQCLQRAAT